MINIQRIGEPFSALTNIRVKKTGKLEKRKHAVYKCVCGNNFIMLVGNEKIRESCGCMVTQRKIKMCTTHGLSDTRLYSIYRDILQRCLNEENDQYYLYGGRGITICKEWLQFENFYKDMGEKPKGLSIDRIDNSKGYCKENCRWATPKEQARNRRDNTILVIDGSSKIIKEWSEISKIKYTTIISRLIRGWSPKRAVFEKEYYGKKHPNIVTTRKSKSRKRKGYYGVVRINFKVVHHTDLYQTREEAKVVAKTELFKRLAVIENSESQE